MTERAPSAVPSSSVHHEPSSCAVSLGGMSRPPGCSPHSVSRSGGAHFAMSNGVLGLRRLRSGMSWSSWTTYRGSIRVPVNESATRRKARIPCGPQICTGGAPCSRPRAMRQRRPGRPKQWSPWAWVTKMRSRAGADAAALQLGLPSPRPRRRASTRRARAAHGSTRRASATGCHQIAPLPRRPSLEVGSPCSTTPTSRARPPGCPRPTA